MSKTERERLANEMENEVLIKEPQIALASGLLFRTREKNYDNKERDINSVSLWERTLCGLVVRVRFLAVPDFLRSSRSGKGSTQPRQYN
jgi:hypothetical protein